MAIKKLQQLITHISSKTPLKILLITLFVGQIVIIGSLTSYLSYRNGQQAVDELATQLRNEITAHIHEKLTNYLEKPHLINQINAQAIRLGQLNLNDIASVEKHLSQQIQIKEFYQTVGYIGLGTEKPQYFGAKRVDENTLELDGLVKVPNGEYHLLTWFADPQGNPTKIDALNEKPYDPRTRLWYKTAINAGQPVWTDIFAYFAGKKIAISANQPIYDGQNQLIGVATTDLMLTGISQFLQKLEIGKTGETFIVERQTGELVTSSTLETPVLYDEQGKVLKDTNDRVKKRLAVESGDPLISGTARYLHEKFGEWTAITGNHHLNFSMNGAKEFLQITDLKDKRGLDWLVVVVIPEADFMASIHNNTLITIALTVLAVLIASFIGALIAEWIIQPIFSLNRAAKRLSFGRWAQDLPTHRTDELGDLAKSFNRMAFQLKDLIDTLELKVENRTEELSKAYKRLKSSQAQLVQSEKMASLGQMVAGVAHEINTPLGYVKNNLQNSQKLLPNVEALLTAYGELFQLMQAEEPDEAALTAQMQKVAELAENFEEDEILKDLQELAGDSLHGIQQISELVVNLKNFSRLDQAKVENVDLNQALDSVLSIAHNLLKYRITVKKLYGELPPVTCSPSQINQVFLNLITNSAQAIADKGTITIKTYADEQWVHVSIQDNGKGIAKADLNKIFDPFFTTKLVGEGTGLGLSISYQIVRQHQGKIRVGSQEGKGTRFLVSLPHQLIDSKETDSKD